MGVADGIALADKYKQKKQVLAVFTVKEPTSR